MICMYLTNRDMRKVDMTIEEFERLVMENWQCVTTTDWSGHNPQRTRTMHIVSWYEEE